MATVGKWNAEPLDLDLGTIFEVDLDARETALLTQSLRKVFTASDIDDVGDKFAARKLDLGLY